MDGSRKSVYVAGPIFGCADEECVEWRHEAKKILGDSFVVIDPTVRDCRGLEDELFRDLVKLDLEDIDRSDFVLANVSRPSWGTAMEIFYAARSGKPVVAFSLVSDAISPWLRCHSVAVFRSMVVACDAIKNFHVLKERV